MAPPKKLPGQSVAELRKAQRFTKKVTYRAKLKAAGTKNLEAAGQNAAYCKAWRERQRLIPFDADADLTVCLPQFWYIGSFLEEHQSLRAQPDMSEFIKRRLQAKV